MKVVTKDFFVEVDNECSKKVTYLSNDTSFLTKRTKINKLRNLNVLHTLEVSNKH